MRKQVAIRRTNVRATLATAIALLLPLAGSYAQRAASALSSKDSAALIGRVREAEFHYLMEWRHEWELWRLDVTLAQQDQIKAISKLPEPPLIKLPVGVCNKYPLRADQQECLRTSPGCDGAPGANIGTPSTDFAAEVFRYDLDQHECAAHLVRAPVRWRLSLVPFWVLPIDSEPADEALGIDDPLSPEWRDSVRALRLPLLALLDSAAYILSGDGWLAGQRVRMHVDQKEFTEALRATIECQAAAWWCLALRGYARFAAHDEARAAATFDSAERRMPAAARCRWDDIAVLLPYTARTAYEKLTCTEQASVNARVWWLADPLYLETVNARKTDHSARLVLGQLHAGNDADERADMRDDYAGLAWQEMVLRYGWPTSVEWSPPCDNARRLFSHGCHVPPGWSRFDTHDVDLDVNTAPNVAPPIRYWGPQYHTIPTWSAINDPLHAKATDWELGPERQDSVVWDASWWAPEFYRRYNGPLVDLSTQIAFVRRHASAAIVAAMDWGIDPAILAPPAHAVVGVITSGGPGEKPHIVGAKADGAHPRAILTPVESRPLLLGVEMVPDNDSGAAGRTRFGIAPPPPLSALKPGDLALSDLMLVRAAPGESYPTSIQDVLPRMYGSTALVNPTRLAIFWEVYGQGDGDTVDVSLRIMRRSDASSLARAAAAVGIGHAGDDSIAVKWREPRPGDPLAFAEKGVSIRPCGFALDVSALSAGEYTLSVRVDRRGASATSTPRELTIVRR